ncbi:uncharacterized protein LOC129946516 [Eupeodes corollae]|uniref:uncharacterized protein LOC129946516 n=1 Tax=Eupeodes corollae TaxID=290404 RepID=UPI00249225C9|nr:uncharacterized protein LOC129946516 [Eupeodes corollae]
MSQAWTKFLNEATIVVLKAVLRSLLLPTSGSKAELKRRVEVGVKDLTDDDLRKLIQETSRESTVESADEQFSDAEDNNEEPRSEEEILDEELEKLHRIFKKKQEIHKLQKQLQEFQLEESATSTKSTTVCFRDIEDSIPPFSGDDNLPVQRWIEQFEDYSEILGLDERSKFLYGKRLLTGTAKLYIRTIITKSWQDMKTYLINEFKKNVTKADVYSDLQNRKKRHDETFQQYVLSMMEIASQSVIEEEDIIQFIIKGIADVEINKSILYNANTIIELKSALRKYEKLKRNCRNNFSDVRPSRSTPNSSHARNITPSRSNVTNQGFNRINTQTTPDKREVSCFKCGKQGHISPHCSGKKSVMIVNTKDQVEEKEKIDLPASVNTCEENESSSNEFEKIISFNFVSDQMDSSATLLTLLDSGSPISFVQAKYIPPFLISTLDLRSHKYVGVNNSPLDVLGSISCIISFENSFINLQMLVVKNNSMSYPVILGRDFMGKNGLVLQQQKKNSVNEIDRDLQLSSGVRDAPATSQNNELITTGDDVNFVFKVMNIDLSCNGSLITF